MLTPEQFAKIPEILTEGETKNTATKAEVAAMPQERAIQFWYRDDRGHYIFPFLPSEWLIPSAVKGPIRPFMTRWDLKSLGVPGDDALEAQFDHYVGADKRPPGVARLRDEDVDTLEMKERRREVYDQVLAAMFGEGGMR